MATRLSPYWLVPALAVGGVAAYLLTGRAPSTPAEPMGLPHETPKPAERPHAPETATTPPAEMPPHHAPTETPGEAAVKWAAPSAWTSQPSSSPMRIATYKVTDATEVSVIRAGGSVEANISRWVGQFDGAPRPDRTTRKVRGLDVTIVHLAGTYTSGGMMMGPPEKHEGWGMLAAVVEPGGGFNYFFKLVGPAAEVDKARPGFESLVASLAPNTPEAGAAASPASTAGGW